MPNFNVIILVWSSIAFVAVAQCDIGICQSKTGLSCCAVDNTCTSQMNACYYCGSGMLCSDVTAICAKFSCESGCCVGTQCGTKDQCARLVDDDHSVAPVLIALAVIIPCFLLVLGGFLWVFRKKSHMILVKRSTQNTEQSDIQNSMNAANMSVIEQMICAHPTRKLEDGHASRGDHGNTDNHSIASARRVVIENHEQAIDEPGEIVSINESSRPAIDLPAVEVNTDNQAVKEMEVESVIQ